MSNQNYKFKIGDRVETNRHKDVGTISEVHESCPQSNTWLSKLGKPVTAESVRKPWYSIDTEPDGQVVVPEYDIKLCKL